VAGERDKPAKHRTRDHAARSDASLDEALRKLGRTILNEAVPEILCRTLDATAPSVSPSEHREDEPNTPPAIDHRSFRDMLLFSIGFAIQTNRPLLRRILKEHVSDDARHQLAKELVEHLELSGFQIDEERQVMTKRRPTHDHG
jgi:hypothetical protein